jgi:hypothetical protein
LPELRFEDKDQNIHEQIHVKIFRVGRKTCCWNPQIHGDFGKFPFWDRRFWEPKTPTDERAPYVRWDDEQNCRAGG